METVTDFIFLVSKITMNGACSHDIKKIYAPQKKSYDIVRHCIKKKKKKKKPRDITLPTKVNIVKVMVFPVDCFFLQ